MGDNEKNENLRRLQEVNLRMIHLLDELCRKYYLTYYALGGTLLGAVRHKGFIPWDDDVDIGMPRPDFEHFLKIAENALPEGYRLRTIRTADEYQTYMVKLEDLNTRIFREYYTVNGKEKRAVYAWIDVMPIDGAPADRRQMKEHLQKIRHYKQMVSFSLLDKCMGTAKKRSSRQKKVIRFGLQSGCYRLLNTKRLYRRLEKECMRYPYESAPLLGNSYGIYGRKEYVRRNVFGRPVYLTFEDMQIACPQQYDRYLRHVYGDYMQLPPEEERKGHVITFA